MKPTDPKLNEAAKAFSNVEQPLLDHAFILGDICGQLATTGGASLAKAMKNLDAAKEREETSGPRAFRGMQEILNYVRKTEHFEN